MGYYIIVPEYCMIEYIVTVKFQAKLVQSKKPSERKAVKKAYQEAIMHRCKVTGRYSVQDSFELYYFVGHSVHRN